jgi:hypothetical protein
MGEEIWAKFHRVIIGLRKDYRAVVKLSVFQEKSQVLLGFFLILKNISLMSHSAFLFSA